MDVTLSIVPPGGGSATESIDVDMQVAPQIGEYLCVDYGDDGVSAFRVRSVTHHLQGTMWASGASDEVGHTNTEAQVEPVDHADMGEGQARRFFDTYANDPRWFGKLQTYPATGDGST